MLGTRFEFEYSDFIDEIIALRKFDRYYQEINVNDLIRIHSAKRELFIRRGPALTDVPVHLLHAWKAWICEHRDRISFNARKSGTSAKIKEMRWRCACGKNEQKKSRIIFSILLLMHIMEPLLALLLPPLFSKEPTGEYSRTLKPRFLSLIKLKKRKWKEMIF